MARLGTPERNGDSPSHRLRVLPQCRGRTLFPGRFRGPADQPFTLPHHHLTDESAGRVRHFPSSESIRDIPRNPAIVVTGAGAIWTLNDPLAIYGS
jgi:hypothetical protein